MDDEICTIEELRAIYRNPGRGAIEKEHDSIGPHDRTFIAHSPIVMIGTSDSNGRCDVSPKGGPPGFVAVLDDGRVAIPDLSGNNRLDSLQNLLEHPGVALLFLIPGIDETLRVNGRASLTTDPAVLSAAAVGDVVPRVAIAIEVDEVYIHCAKALRRGNVWQHDQWPDTSDMPTIATMVRDQFAPTLDVAVIEKALEDDYETTLWRTGG